MNFVILANVFIDPFSERLCIGGLQTYIKDLAHLAQKMGYNVIVVQSDNQGLNKTVDYDDAQLSPSFSHHSLHPPSLFPLSQQTTWFPAHRTGYNR